MKPFTRSELVSRVHDATKGRFALTTYSPGDGVTRYKIVEVRDGGPDYFAGRDVVSALGLQGARDMVSAFLAGYFAR